MVYNMLNDIIDLTWHVWILKFIECIIGIITLLFVSKGYMLFEKYGYCVQVNVIYFDMYSTIRW